MTWLTAVHKSRQLTGFVVIALSLTAFAMGQTELYFAQAIRGNAQNTTDIFVQSIDSDDVDVTVRFYKVDGTLDETQMTTLEPNGSDKITLGGPQVDPFRVGYAVVSATGNVAATAFYTLRVGATSLPTIGVLPVTGSTTWRTFAKIEPGVVNSGIAVAIPNAGMAPAGAEPKEAPNCQLTLYNGTDGMMAGSTAIDFGDDQHIARFITDPSWIPGAAGGFEGPAVLACDAEVVATALTQQAKDNALATVAMEPTSGSTEVYFAQAIRGNALNTTDIFVQNGDSSDVDVTVKFYGADGTLEETQLTTLKPNGGDKLTLGGPQVDPFSVGYAAVSATGNVVATAFYKLQVGPTSLPTIGVLPVTGSSSWRTFVKIQPGVVNSGLAVAVPNGAASADSRPAADPGCQLTLYDGTTGSMAGSATIDFGDDQHVARFITDPSWIPGVASGFEGAGVLACTDQVVATTLTQQASDNALATVAMVQTDEEPGNGGGDPGTGTALLPKRVTGLSLTSNKTLDQTLGLGVQIKGTISGGNFPAASNPSQFVLIQGVHAICNNLIYTGTVDFTGGFLIPVPKQTTCDVYIDFLDSSGFGGGFSSGAVPAQQETTIFVQEKMSPAVPVGDSDVIRDFMLSPLQLETVEGSVSNLSSLPPELLQTDIILAFATNDDTITAFTTLEAGGDSRNYMIDVPDNRDYVASIQLIEQDQAMNFLQIVAIYDLGSVNLADASSPMSIRTANITADFSVPSTGNLSGTVSEAGKTSVPDYTLVSARDTRFTEIGGSFSGLAGGISTAAVQNSGDYDLTLVLNRQYDFFTGIPINDSGLWGMPTDPGTDVFSFNGSTTRNVSFPTRPAEVTLMGMVDGPAVMTTTENEGVGNVSVSVTCRNLSGAPNTFFSGSTQTNSSGNYSLQVLSGTDCEVEFRPLLLSEFPFSTAEQASDD
jgi:hypothetical protein